MIELPNFWRSIFLKVGYRCIIFGIFVDVLARGMLWESKLIFVDFYVASEVFEVLKT